MVKVEVYDPSGRVSSRPRPPLLHLHHQPPPVMLYLTSILETCFCLHSLIWNQDALLPPLISQDCWRTRLKVPRNQHNLTDQIHFVEICILSCSYSSASTSAKFPLPYSCHQPTVSLPASSAAWSQKPTSLSTLAPVPCQPSSTT